jgi:hypothetical protein
MLALNNKVNFKSRAGRVAGYVLAIASTLLICVVAASAGVFTVTTTADNGNNANPTPGSLRKAILDANSNGSAVTDNINFNIAGGGVKTFTPKFKLPSINTPTFLDGYTQPGAKVNTLANGINAVLLIELNGAMKELSPFTEAGLSIASSGVTVRGLIINRFGAGIFVFSATNNIKITGNFLGTDATGLIDLGNANDGIEVFNSQGTVTIGGASLADRNLISGNGWSGISNISPDTTLNVIGNYIGTNKNGSGDLGNDKHGVVTGSANALVEDNVIAYNGLVGLGIFKSNIVKGNNISHNTGNGVNVNGPNCIIGGTQPGDGNMIRLNGGHGINLEPAGTDTKIVGNAIGVDFLGLLGSGNQKDGIFVNSDTNKIGGPTAAERNFISDNMVMGIEITATSSHNTIRGNYIGTSPSGKSLGNFDGIFVNGGDVNTIGGVAAGEGNVISGNARYGVNIANDAELNKVQGNFIGTKADGVTALANGVGIRIEGSRFNVIGGPGGQNVIALNNGRGVVLDAGTTNGNNLITENSIFSNGSLGIDLGGNGVTPNDANDVDNGANRLLNFPVISSAVSGNGQIVVAGSLNSIANITYTIHFYANAACDASGNGEGQTFIGSLPVTAPGNNVNLAATFPVNVTPGTFLTATTTDGSSSTSEFSQCVQVTQVPASTLQFSQSSFTVNESGGSATISVARAGGNSGAVSVQYQTAAGGAATENTDYTPVSGTLTWSNGDAASKTFTVPVANDLLYEGDESINLTLTNPSGGATLGGQNTATLLIVNDESKPAMTISKVSQSEGNNGVTNFVFTVSLSPASSQPLQVSYSSPGETATVGSDFSSTSGDLVFNPGETSKTITVPVVGDKIQETDEVFYVHLSKVSSDFEFVDPIGVGTIVNDDAAPTPTVQFGASTYSVQEDMTSVSVTVTRTGDTSATTTVDYATSDHSNPADFIPCTSAGFGLASSRCDFTTAVGTLRFAAGETTKTFKVLITEDNYPEGTETLELVLSNLTGGAVLGVPSTAVISITDDLVEPANNPIDSATGFVHSQYHDFLNREPDALGLSFWTDNIEKCNDPARLPAGQTVAQCLDKQRESTAIAFFSSPEFQMTGGFVYRLYKGSLTGSPNYDAGSPGRFPTSLEFMRDVRQVSEGIVVNNQISGTTVEANRNQLAADFVLRPEFAARYGGLNNALYVQELFNTTSIAATADEKQALVEGLNNGTETRASVLRKIVDGTVVITEGNVQFTTAYGQAFYNQEYRRVFVFMEYVGYLRRNPDAPGFVFWLGKLNQYNGDPFQAEMVRSFILSPEYRSRFGQP